jgi:hypothetical protein
MASTFDLEGHLAMVAQLVGAKLEPFSLRSPGSDFSLPPSDSFKPLN